MQAQAILTLRIYHSVSLYDDSSLPPLQIPDVRIEQLGEARTYEKDINGLRHGVIEMRGRNYPQQSGELIIPAQIFNAALVDAKPPQDATSQVPKSQAMRVSSTEILLTVKAKPSSYPADVPWLPARSLSLSESWNLEPDHAQVGDSLTRRRTMKVEGLASSQLPPLAATDVNGLRRYPGSTGAGQPEQRARPDRQSRIPRSPGAARSGAIELPAVEVVWWNTFEDHLEHSSLPARTLQVANNPNLMVDTPTGTPQVMSAANSEALWWWKLSTLILACTTLLGFSLWWRARWQPAILRAAQTGPSPRTVLDDLKRACQANDSHATRQRPRRLGPATTRKHWQIWPPDSCRFLMPWTD